MSVPGAQVASQYDRSPMDADWYEDPLGRYDGRFFDGESWTAEVSDGGALSIDEDFPPSADGSQEQVVPAVAPISTSTTVRATPGSESPVRVVAILDESLVARPVEERREITEPEGRSRTWLVAGLLAVAALLAVIFLTRSNGTDLDPDQADRVEDLQAGTGGDGVDLDELDVDALDVDAPEVMLDPDAVFDPSDVVTVGTLNVVNGSSMLAALVEWHQGFATGRGVRLGADHGCWFGELGTAAVQVAHCGPVGGSADTEYLFDLVPVDFIDIEEGQLAQPVVDAVMPDTVIANAVTLIGSADGPAPPESLTQTRGERGSG